MPHANIGTLVLDHALFLIHLCYFNLALSHADQSLLTILYLVTKVFASRGQDYKEPLPTWPPPGTTP